VLVMVVVVVVAVIYYCTPSIAIQLAINHPTLLIKTF
jgi:hypothetical protein